MIFMSCHVIRRIALFALCFMLTFPAAAAPQQIDYGRSRITIISKQMNVPLEGHFKKFAAQIVFDPNRPEAGKVEVDIDVGSFDIGQPDFNDEAKTRNWFDARAFPRATFVSSGMRGLGDGRFEARGPLTIKGRTADVVIPFTYRKDAGGAFEGAFTIKRLQYNIGEGAWRDTDTVADDVQIKFRIFLNRGPAAGG